MRISDIRIIGNVSADRLGDSLCMFGKVNWECEYHPLKEDSYEVNLDITKNAQLSLSFDGLPCNSLLSVLNAINVLPFKKDTALDIPGVRIMHKDMTKKYFTKAMRDIFGLAIASVPSKFIEIGVTVKEELEKA